MKKIDREKVIRVEEFKRIGGRLVLTRTMTLEEAEGLKRARIEKAKRTREKKKQAARRTP